MSDYTSWSRSNGIAIQRMREQLPAHIIIVDRYLDDDHEYFVLRCDQCRELADLHVSDVRAWHAHELAKAAAA